MSKNINVNPNFYKVGGREHAEGHGEAITPDRDRQLMASSQKGKGTKVVAGGMRGKSKKK